MARELRNRNARAFACIANSNGHNADAPFFRCGGGGLDRFTLHVFAIRQNDDDFSDALAIEARSRQAKRVTQERAATKRRLRCEWVAFVQEPTVTVS